MKKLLSILMVFTLALVLLGTSKTYAYATGSNMFDQTTITSRTPYESGSEYYLQLPPPASGAYSLDNNNISNADIGLLENVEYTLSATGKGFGGEINLKLTIWYTNGTLDTRYSTAFGLTDERLSVTFTPDSGKVVDRIVLSGGNIGAHDLLIRKDSIMIEEGSTMSPYLAFGEVAAPINLLDGETIQFDQGHGAYLEVDLNAGTYVMASPDYYSPGNQNYFNVYDIGANDFLIEDDSTGMLNGYSYLTFTVVEESNVLRLDFKTSGTETLTGEAIFNVMKGADLLLQEGSIPVLEEAPIENILREHYIKEVIQDTCSSYEFVNIPVKPGTDYTFSINSIDVVAWNGITLFIEGNIDDFIAEDLDFNGVDMFADDVIYYTFNTGLNTIIKSIKQTTCSGNSKQDLDTYGVEFFQLEEGTTPSSLIKYTDYEIGANLIDITNAIDNSGSWYLGSYTLEPYTDYTFSMHDFDTSMISLQDTYGIEQNDGNVNFEDTFIETDGTVSYMTFNTGPYAVYTFTYGHDGSGITTSEVYSGVKLEKGTTPTAYRVFVIEVPSITSTSAVVYSDIENPYSLAQINATVTAADNQDGNLTSSMTIDASDFIGNESTLGTYTIDYSVMDSDGHTTVFSLQVRVIDVDIPIITLIGLPTITIEFGGTYTEPGANTIDNVDGVMNEIINSNVNISVLGTYQVIYSATDSSGHDAVERTRTVIIEDTIAPTLTGDTTIDLFTTDGRTVQELIDEEFTTNDLHGVTESYIENDIYTGNETVPGTYTFDIVLSDLSGNDFVQTITINVSEDAAPVITTTLPIMTIEEADALTPEELRALFGK